VILHAEQAWAQVGLRLMQPSVEFVQVMGHQIVQLLISLACACIYVLLVEHVLFFLVFVHLEHFAA
jgi:hypothetical protein